MVFQNLSLGTEFIPRFRRKLERMLNFVSLRLLTVQFIICQKASVLLKAPALAYLIFWPIEF